MKVMKSMKIPGGIPESLCRSSAVYLALRGDPMYAFQEKRPLPDSSGRGIFRERFGYCRVLGF